MFKLFDIRLRILVSAIALLAVISFQFSGISITSVSADSTAQPLPFAQDWTANVLTTNDNWTPVLGIEAYLGQDITVATATDPQTLLTTSALPNDLDLIANQTNPNTLTSGGVAEFDTLANPTVALQGSGTADAPYVLLYLNTTGQSNINVAYKLRDVDGSADNSIQPVALQYRIGNTGNFTNVAAGFVADASAGPSTATLETPVSATLPGDANNQALVQVRIMTTNAVGSDEWIGVDDINVTAGPAAPTQHVLDFNGDGKTDYALVRNIGGGPSGQIRWFINYTGTATTVASDWGLNGDNYVPADYDGDNKSDIAVWRGLTNNQPSGNAFFYILQSQTNTVRIDDFGITGDNPSVVGDYNGDGKDDVAVYRPGASVGQNSVWYWRTAVAGPISNQIWGLNGDFPAPGDYDGDGKNDFVIQRNNGGGNAIFWFNRTTAGISNTVFGTPTDQIVPGDYDGDGKTDLATVRAFGAAILWWHLRSSDGAAVQTVFGVAATDFPLPGDYDGDGKSDHAIWRTSAVAGESAFWFLGSTSGAFSQPMGSSGDFPVANALNN
ncbi:MAG: VCBS repeat-containing protein [Acidobacteria bacterium]|nr:VCBS repeat-containing protein [Acidobacteriota bacterium]